MRSGHGNPTRLYQRPSKNSSKDSTKDLTKDSPNKPTRHFKRPFKDSTNKLLMFYQITLLRYNIKLKRPTGEINRTIGRGGCKLLFFCSHPPILKGLKGLKIWMHIYTFFAATPLYFLWMLGYKIFFVLGE